MKKVVLLGCLALGACSVPQVAAVVTPVVLPPQQVQHLQTTCQIAAPALDVAAQPTMPPVVNETALPASVYCKQLLSGVVPPTTDTNTPKWLPKVIAGVKVAAEIARVAIPLIAPLF